jgi:hypothetical protein
MCESQSFYVFWAVVVLRDGALRQDTGIAEPARVQTDMDGNSEPGIEADSAPDVEPDGELDMKPGNGPGSVADTEPDSSADTEAGSGAEIELGLVGIEPGSGVDMETGLIAPILMASCVATYDSLELVQDALEYPLYV